MTLIDNIFLNKELSIDYRSWILLDDISDQCLVSIKNVVPDRKDLGFTCKRKLDKKAIDSIKQDMSNMNWACYLEKLTCEDAFNIFHDKLMTIIDKHAPEHSVCRKGKKLIQPWITKGIRNCICKQKKLYSQWLSHRNNNSLRESYLNYKAFLQKVIRFCKRTYYSELCTQHRHNSKKLWGLINYIIRHTPNKTNIIECLTVNNIKSHDAQEIANELGRHF